MKKPLSLSLLVGSALLLASCDTLDGPRSGGARPAQVAKQRRQAPQPFYARNASGNYYSATGDGLNPEYQPEVKRFDPARRNVSAPPPQETRKWRKPVPLEGTEFRY